MNIISYFYYRYIDPTYSNAIRDKNGKHRYAELCMDTVASRTTDKGKKIREEIEHQDEVHKDLNHRLNETLKHPLLENDEYFSLRKKIRTQQFLFWILVLAEFGLNYLTTLIFMGASGLLYLVVRITIAITVTAVAVISAEKFLEEIIPKEKNKDFNLISFSIWLLLLIFVEVSIYYFGLVRGADFEGGATGEGVTTALVIISMVIPLVAGGIRWDLFSRYDAYKNRQSHDNTAKKINETETKLELLKEKENTFFQSQCNDYWYTLDLFCLYKSRYNEKCDLPEESLENHKFANNIDSFKAEAEKRYKNNLAKSEFDKVSSKIDNFSTELDNKLNS